MHAPNPEQNPFAAPDTESTGAKDRPVPAEKALRVAGIMLLVNSVFALIQIVAFPTDGMPAGFLAPIIDAAIAISFLQGKEGARGFAIFRIIAGMVVFGGLSIGRGDYVTPVFVALGSAGMLLVLIGKPARARITAGASMYGVFALLQIIGLLML